MTNNMTSAQNTATPDDQQKTTEATPTIVASTTGKEQEGAKIVAAEGVAEVGREVELPKEVEKAGVEVVKETIELPPDVKKLGVTTTGPSVPVATATTIPQVALPISDQQVVVGLHAQILSSLRWLAIWCIRKLKKAHIALKKIHGKIIRVRT